MAFASLLPDPYGPAGQQWQRKEWRWKQLWGSKWHQQYKQFRVFETKGEEIGLRTVPLKSAELVTVQACDKVVVTYSEVALITFSRICYLIMQSTRRATAQSQGSTPGAAQFDLESGLPLVDGTLAQQQQQQQQQDSQPEQEEGDGAAWRNLLSMEGFRAAVNRVTSSIGSPEAAAGTSDREANCSLQGGNDKPPMRPLVTWQPLRAVAANPGVRGAANTLDSIWSASSRLARVAPPGARVAVVSYFIILHVISWLSMMWRHCP